MNADTNACLYVIQDNSDYSAEARSYLSSNCKLTSVVVGEILYKIYWDVIDREGIQDLHGRDRERSFAAQAIFQLYDEGLLGGSNELVIRLGLELFMYRRLDWADCYLLANKSLNNESFTTFDSGMLRLLNDIAVSGNKIPVISSYTLPVDELPSHFFIRKQDKKQFEKAGLLHLEDLAPV